MARRHLLIGSGPGSVAAAEMIRRRDEEAEIVIVGDEPHGYYSRPGLAYYLANEVPEARLFPFSPRDFARIDVRLLLGRAAHVDRASHTVTLEDGSMLPYDRLLLATGSRAIPTDAPGAELDGVVKLDDLNDARDLIRRARTAKTAVVIGGGITALEIVEGMRARHVQVHYFMRKGRYWSNVLSEPESRIVEEGLRARGVQIHDFTSLSGILGRQGRVVGVETDGGARIDCDLVAVALGVRPQKELAEAAGLDCDRGVLVDEHLRSSDEDIFVAGDIAEVCATTTGRRTLEVLWNTAVDKGRIAGLNMATGPRRVYDTGTPLNVTRLAGHDITIIGIVGSGRGADLKGLSRGDSQTWAEGSGEVMVESHSGEDHLRLALSERTIAGAVVIGDQAISFPLQRIIEKRLDVSDILASLLQPAARVAEIVRGFWSQAQVQRA
ncbi:MAG: NAD(P)/FAD-dependent oxidoreductase [Planctomycetaceae bacterium]